MWVGNGQIRLPDGALLVEAAVLAGAYLLRAWSVAGYMQRVRERAFGVPRPRLEGRARPADSHGTPAGVESGPERCCSRGAYDRRRVGLVL
jgi:hypothetical protein